LTETAAIATHRRIEAVARESYGRLIAYLCARTRDLAAAEDALSEALLTALATWPRDGVPNNPEGWLLTAARNRIIDRARHARVREQSTATLELLAREPDDPAAQ
jgi:predicted RNA polymerase sigma factor